MTALAAKCKTVLKRFLEEEFGPEATVRSEAPLFRKRPLGYNPKCDFKVECTFNGGKVFVWIELEYVRADPVANPAKFLVAFDRQELGADGRHVFISAISDGVSPGRKQLCREFIEILGTLKRDFVVKSLHLLPSFEGSEILKFSAAGAKLDSVLDSREPVLMSDLAKFAAAVRQVAACAARTRR